MQLVTTPIWSLSSDRIHAPAVSPSIAERLAITHSLEAGIWNSISSSFCVTYRRHSVRLEFYMQYGISLIGSPAFTALGIRVLIKGHFQGGRVFKRSYLAAPNDPAIEHEKRHDLSFENCDRASTGHGRSDIHPAWVMFR